MQYCPKESGRGYLFVVKYKREKVNNIKGTGKVSVFVCFFITSCHDHNVTGLTELEQQETHTCKMVTQQDKTY